MSRGPQHFRQTDLTKAIRAALAAGLPVWRVEIAPDGRVIIIARRPEQEQNFKTETNEWDSVK